MLMPVSGEHESLGTGKASPFQFVDVVRDDARHATQERLLLVELMRIGAHPVPS